MKKWQGILLVVLVGFMCMVYGMLFTIQTIKPTTTEHGIIEIEFLGHVYVYEGGE